MSAREIANRVRAFKPWPGTYTNFRGGRLVLWRVHEAPDAANGSGDEAGAILSIVDSGIMIACAGSTALLVEEVQVEGKRRVPAREFANGARLKAGEEIYRE